MDHEMNHDYKIKKDKINNYFKKATFLNFIKKYLSGKDLKNVTEQKLEEKSRIFSFIFDTIRGKDILTTEALRLSFIEDVLEQKEYNFTNVLSKLHDVSEAKRQEIIKSIEDVLEQELYKYSIKT